MSMRLTKRSTRFCLLGLAAALVSCQTPEAPGVSPLGLPAPIASAPPRVNATIAATPGAKMVFEDRRAPPSPVAPPIASASGDHGEQAESLNFVDTDIREVARVILGTTLKLTYTIDPAVHGTATLETQKPLARDRLLATLETLLNQNGATLVKRDDLYAVVPIAAATTTNVVPGPIAGGAGTQVVTLRYASARELAKLLEPYVSEGAKLAADASGNALVISGDGNARQALISLIRQFDTDTLAGQSFAMFTTADGDAPRLAATMERALQADSSGPLAGLVRVIPLPRANAVLVASAQQHYLDEARRIFRLTGRARDATARRWHVYYVRNGQLATLENLLQRAFTPRSVSPNAPGATASGAEPVALGSGPSLQNVVSPVGRAGAAGLAMLGDNPAAAAASTNASTPSAYAAPPTALAANPPAGEALSGATGTEGESEDRIRIVGDRDNNALLIYATGNEYSAIEEMLRKTDITPLQVLIEATVAEVTLTDQLTYGTQFYLGSKLAGILTTAGPFTAPTTAASGATSTVVTVGGVPTTIGSHFPGFVLANGMREVLNALTAVTQVKVLSSPHLMVVNNQPARLQVGQQVPVLTGTATSTLASGAPIVNSIDYHATGVIMQITPRINAGNQVTLDIAQEVSDVAPAATNTATGSPTFNDRLVRTRVALQDGQTVALAGLIRDNDSQSNSGLPFLKDVPIVGSLLSSQDNTRTRSELLVLITPHMVRDQNDARILTEDLRQELHNAAVVQPQLTRQPLRGSANPNGL